MEGEIARQLQNGFAFKITAPPRKIEKLAARIGWLVCESAAPYDPSGGCLIRDLQHRSAVGPLAD
jgi:hypothetical protein